MVYVMAISTQCGQLVGIGIEHREEKYDIRGGV
jgi:hypothetical protein